MDLNLGGKKAVITGASRGVGKAIALGLAAEGVDVAICASHSGMIEKVAEEIRALGVEAYPMVADMSSPESTLAFMHDAEEKLGQIDILVNNAAVWLQGWCEEITLEDWQKTMDLNLTGPFLTSQYFAKSNLEKNRHGRIININSQAAFNGSTSGHVHYAASKAGMVAVTVSMARELSKKGITVNGVAIGIVETAMTEKSLKANPGYYETRIPMGRVAQPEEIANLVVFMASDKASYITGATLDISGGMLMR